MHSKGQVDDGRVTAQSVEQHPDVEFAPTLAKVPEATDLFVQIDEPVVNDER